jgi:thiamine-phosphate pyrophosphorylase
MQSYSFRQLIQRRGEPLIYLITDRHQLARQDASALIRFVESAFSAGVDMVQIREKDLSARALMELTEQIASISRRFGAALLINDRADIAACAAAGVHLTTNSIRAHVIRRTFGPDMLIGASTHSLEELQEAQSGGADFVVFGPVFKTKGKQPVGLGALQEASRLAQIPVLALGGVNLNNFSEALAAGARGIAGISIFTEAEDLSDLVGAIKGWKRPKTQGEA